MILEAQEGIIHGRCKGDSRAKPNPERHPREGCVLLETTRHSKKEKGSLVSRSVARFRRRKDFEK